MSGVLKLFSRDALEAVAEDLRLRGGFHLEEAVYSIVSAQVLDHAPLGDGSPGGYRAPINSRAKPGP
jgi:hypothetical protein